MTMENLYLKRSYQGLPELERQSMRNTLLDGFRKLGIRMEEFGPDVLSTVERLLFPNSPQGYLVSARFTKNLPECSWKCSRSSRANCPLPGSHGLIFSLRPVPTPEINAVFRQGQVPGILGLLAGCPWNESGIAMNILSFTWFSNVPRRPFEGQILAVPQFTFSPSQLSRNVLTGAFVQRLAEIPLPVPQVAAVPAKEKTEEKTEVSRLNFATLEAYYQSLGKDAQTRLEAIEGDDPTREHAVPIVSEWLRNLAHPSEKDQEIFSLVRNDASDT